MSIPKLPLGSWVEGLEAWLESTLGGLFEVIRTVIGGMVDGCQWLLQSVPWFVMIAVLSLIILAVARWRMALFTFIGLLLVFNLGYWDHTMMTLSQVLTSAVISIVLGVPIGILCARRNGVQKVVTPLLDFMQTMPAFVYLLPAVSFFSLGVVPGVIASVVFAIPPTIRLTNLGIRQVPMDLVEAADAFGSTPMQKLVKLQLPLAVPSIMAGINQTIMLSLSMVVISSMIGAQGLGSDVYRAVTQNKIGSGFEAGVAVVILAIILDRFTQNVVNRRKQGQIRWKKPLIWVSLAALVISAILTNVMSTGGTGKQIKLSYVAWDSEIASTNVVKVVLQDKLGYNVDMLQVDIGPMWTGISNGSVDAMVAAWLPRTAKSYYDANKGKFDELGANLEGTKLGLVVPSYLENVNSIEDLKKPEVRDQFGGKIIGIEPGAGIMEATQKALKDYGLSDWTLVESSSAAMTTELTKAYENKQPMVVTGWTPHWMFAKMNLKYLDDPKKSYGEDEQIHTVVRKGLKEDKPDAYQFLDQFHWTPKDMEEVMVDVQSGTEPEEAAAKWVQNHPDQVNEWLKGIEVVK